MDRFLEEQESGASNCGSTGGQRDRSASPNIQCLIYGDPKRQHTELNKDKLDSLMSFASAGKVAKLNLLCRCTFYCF